MSRSKSSFNPMFLALPCILGAMTFLGFCSPVATAGSDVRSRTSDNGHAMFALGLGGGSSDIFGGGDSPGSSHLPTGVGDFRFGYEFPTGLLLEGGIAGTSITPGRGEQNTMRKTGDRHSDAFALRVGYGWGRLRLLGGYGVGSLNEQSTLSDKGVSKNVTYDLAGPQISAGFTFFRTRDIDLELTGDVSSSHMAPRINSDDRDERRTEKSDDLQSRRLVTQVYGLRMRLLPGRGSQGSSAAGSSPASTHSTSVFCFDCGRLFVDLVQIAPRLGIELVKGVATVVGGIH